MVVSVVIHQGVQDGDADVLTLHYLQSEGPLGRHVDTHLACDVQHAQHHAQVHRGQTPQVVVDLDAPESAANRGVGKWGGTRGDGKKKTKGHCRGGPARAHLT